MERRKRVEETAVFLQRMLDEPVDSTTSTALREKTEGWIGDLRLAALSQHHRSDRDRIMANLPEESRCQTDYLITLVYNPHTETKITGSDVYKLLRLKNWCDRNDFWISKRINSRSHLK